jgi:hypothetical protein
MADRPMDEIIRCGIFLLIDSVFSPSLLNQVRPRPRAGTSNCGGPTKGTSRNLFRNKRFSMLELHEPGDDSPTTTNSKILRTVDGIAADLLPNRNLILSTAPPPAATKVTDTGLMTKSTLCTVGARTVESSSSTRGRVEPLTIHRDHHRHQS